ncbi:hypothetical protein [Nocardioides sp.]|uniref:hypothetical protein n=1 Tax=Nocardioides sp. TaxID=35761 RepID=UPI002616E056|nr:hypothetical protein [Nocardioides sp.]
MSDSVAIRQPTSSDRVVAIVLLVGLGLISPVISFAALMLAMASDSCGSSSVCDEGGIVGGAALAAVAPWAALVGAIIVVIVRSRRGRSVWWVPIVGALVGAAIFVLGAFVTFNSVN